jgi:outer membrane lipase/esterase
MGIFAGMWPRRYSARPPGPISFDIQFHGRKRGAAMKYTLAIVAISMFAAANPAAAQSFSQFIGFGDSTIDSGSYRILSSPGGGAAFNALWPSAVAAGAGKPTTSPGLVSSEALAALFGLSAIPADQGGANYATSGAKNVTINTTATGGFTAATPTVIQIADYLAANGGRANSGAIYLISSGGNDVSYALGGTGTGPFPANPTAYLQSAAASLAAGVASLQAAGARYFVVPDLPFSFPTGNGSGNPATRQARLTYSQALWSDLAASGVNFIPADYNAVRLAIAATPGAFGFQFTDTTNVACTQPPGVTSAWALLCSSNPAAPSHLVSPNAESIYLFADDQHLTTAGQTILADYEYSLIVAPSEISYLAEAPLQTRTAVIDSIFEQIPISQHGRAPGSFNAWVTGDLSSLRMGNDYNGFPTDPGTPGMVTVGADYLVTTHWLIGAAVSVGTTTQSFSLGGNFRQNEYALSGYAAYTGGPLWFDAIAGYGGLRYDEDRIVPIGITMQSNTGTTNGSNASFAAELGYNFQLPVGSQIVPSPLPAKAPPVDVETYLKHGPLIGIILQRVQVDGFTETDGFAAIGGLTALSFGEQTRDSAVSELGYQARLDLGAWQPFAKVAWNHELAPLDRSVVATLTTTVAPSFSMPAVIFGRDWASGTIGTSVEIRRGVTAYASFNGEIGQNNVTFYGGQLGLNVALDAPPPEPVKKRY